MRGKRAKQLRRLAKRIEAHALYKEVSFRKIYKQLKQDYMRAKKDGRL